MSFENENTEFKARFTEEIYKEVIAFANTEGGEIYVGINDSGAVVGLPDADLEFTRITNGIRDAVMPDVTMFVRSSIGQQQALLSQGKGDQTRRRLCASGGVERARLAGADPYDDKRERRRQL